MYRLYPQAPGASKRWSETGSRKLGKCLSPSRFLRVSRYDIGQKFSEFVSPEYQVNSSVVHSLLLRINRCVNIMSVIDKYKRMRATLPPEKAAGDCTAIVSNREKECFKILASSKGWVTTRRVPQHRGPRGVHEGLKRVLQGSSRSY